ncbi:MAG: plastocyanin/azurin family copper-binding protein [Ilumatobacteraceae bacterium]
MPDSVACRWRWARRVLAPSLVLVVAACADDGPAMMTQRGSPAPMTSPATSDPPPMTSPATSDPAPTGASVRVQTLDNSFRPEAVEVVVGTEVVWTNDGRNEHDVTPSDATPSDVADGTANWGVVAADFEPGAEYRHVFDAPGEYRYYCSIHGTPDAGQIGVIVVTAAASD